MIPKKTHGRRAGRMTLAALGVASIGLISSTVAGAWPSDSDRTSDVREAVDEGRARNVIMFLGDGMGDSEITIARTTRAQGAAGPAQHGWIAAHR